MFSYYADFGDVGENEIDHVSLYNLTDQTDLNCYKNEQDVLWWGTLAELRCWMSQVPQPFISWFSPAMELVLSQSER